MIPKAMKQILKIFPWVKSYKLGLESITKGVGKALRI